MAQQAIDFSLTGDNTTGALVKLDNNVKDHEVRLVATTGTANSANTAAANAQTTANTANATANTANVTASAAMPKAGGTFTGSVSVNGGTLGTTAGASLAAFTVSGNTANVDRLTTVAYRGVAGNNFASAFWRWQRVVDATGFGFMQFGDGTNGGTVILNSVAGSFTLSGTTGNCVASGTVTQNSDYRIKTDDVSIDPTDAAASLRANRPIEYTDTRLPEGSKRLAGFIAHELQANLPLLVEGQKDAVTIEYIMEGEFDPDSGEPPPLVPKEVPALQNVNYIGMVPYLNAGWQFLDAELSRAKDDIASLLARIEALEGRVSTAS